MLAKPHCAQVMKGKERGAGNTPFTALLLRYLSLLPYTCSGSLFHAVEFYSTLEHICILHSLLAHEVFGRRLITARFTFYPCSFLRTPLSPHFSSPELPEVPYTGRKHTGKSKAVATVLCKVHPLCPQWSLVV